ncbi:hypothetical protein ACFX11_009470 [Malus domestica]
MSKRMSGPKRRRMYWGLGRLRSILVATATIDIANSQVFVENGGRTLLSYVGLTFEVCITSVDALSYTCPQRPCGCGFRSPATVQLELGLVDAFLSFCRLGWQRWLAEIEFSFFVLYSSPNRVEQILLDFGFEHVTAAAASHSVGKLMGKSRWGTFCES